MIADGRSFEKRVSRLFSFPPVGLINAGISAKRSFGPRAGTRRPAQGSRQSRDPTSVWRIREPSESPRVKRVSASLGDESRMDDCVTCSEDLCAVCRNSNRILVLKPALDSQRKTTASCGMGLLKANLFGPRIVR